MKKRIILLDISENIQATVLRVINDETERDGLKITAYGHIANDDHIEFSFFKDYPDDIVRDEEFENILLDPQPVSEAILEIIEKSNIPIIK